jgi:large subunit ribosomal protein L4
MKLDVYNLKNEKIGKIDVASEIFAAPIKEHLHQVVVRAQLADRRSGTANAKTRGEVSGSQNKMYKQKGTGRARHSTRKVAQFVGGGRAFPPKPRSFSLKVTKKVRKSALCSALSQKLKDGHLKIVDNFELKQGKTKLVLQAFKTLETGKALVVDQSENNNLKLGARNLKDYKFIAAEGLNVFDLLKFESLLLSKSAVEKIQGRLSS